MSKIFDLSIEAFDLGAHLVVFPELALTGYPPEDLLLRDGFMDQVKNEVDNLCEAIPSNIWIFIIFLISNLFYNDFIE